MSEKSRQAFELYKKGNLGEAEKLCLEINISNPNNYEILNLLGVILFQKKDYYQSIKFTKESLKINPNQSDIYNNLGVAYIEIKKFSDALKYFDNALKINPNFTQAYNNLGIVYKELGRYDDAINCWKKIIKINNNNPQAYNNIGNILLETKNEKDAIEYYEKAIKVDEKFYIGYYNLGNAFQKLNFTEKSIKNFTLAIKFNNYYAEAYYNRGNSYRNLNKLELALEDYHSAYKINPNLQYLFGNILNTKKDLCDWKNYEMDLVFLKKNIHHRKYIINPFSSLSVFDSTEIQKKIATDYVNEKYEKNDIKTKNNFLLTKLTNNKIKIGYYSSDFKEHAVSYLLAGVLEKHNKKEFEIFGFSLAPSKNDKMKERIIKCFDKFIDVSSKSDQEISELSKKFKIDIAIDLMGFTKSNRFGIFLKRCAPIQINYLGYPGTLGSDSVDYIIGDKTIISKENAKYFTEKIIYLPDTYQANDSRKQISTKKFHRKDFNLPNDQFVFCCFNKKYKLDPNTFNLWINILKKVPNSVLWLLDENNTSTKNIFNEAKIRGIKPDRIIFAKSMPMEEHLARQKLADLFLDTFPYGAHTTCSDALWVGLPLITKKGESFASRVSSSLLKSIGMDELITTSNDEYEQLAIELANNKEKIKLIQKKLVKNIKNKPLFNTNLYTLNLEKAFKKVYENCLKNIPKSNIEV